MVARQENALFDRRGELCSPAVVQRTPPYEIKSKFREFLGRGWGNVCEANLTLSKAKHIAPPENMNLNHKKTGAPRRSPTNAYGEFEPNSATAMPCGARREAPVLRPKRNTTLLGGVYFCVWRPK